MKDITFDELKHTILLNVSNNIKLPSKIVIKIETLSNTELQELTKLTLEPKLIREYIYLFLSNFKKQIVEHLQGKKVKETFINMKDEFGSTRKTTTNKKTRIKLLIIDFLIQQDIIELSRNYSTGIKERNLKAHTKAYKINTDYISEPVSIILEEEKTISINKENKKKMLDMITGNIIAESQLKLVYDFQSLDRQKIYEKGLTMVGGEYKGHNFVLNNVNKLKRDKSLETHMRIYDYLMDGDLLIPSISKNNGRVYTSFNLIPGWIRSFLKIDGKLTYGVDISSSIPSILNSVYGGEKIEYSFIVEKYGINYNKAKVDILSFLFSSSYEAKRNHPEIYKYFNENNNDLLLKIEEVKDLYGHTYLANRLFKIESELMKKNISELQDLNIEVYYIFDELIGKITDNETIKSVMNKNLTLFDIKTIVK